MEIWAQLTTLGGMFIATAALIYAFRTESKNDLAKSHADIKEFTSAILAGMNGQIAGINAQVIAIHQEIKDFRQASHEEMKDFHGRLISLEERSRGLHDGRDYKPRTKNSTQE